MPFLSVQSTFSANWTTSKINKAQCNSGQKLWSVIQEKKWHYFTERLLEKSLQTT